MDCFLAVNETASKRYTAHTTTKGSFPQVFLENYDGTNIQYVGDYATIQVSLLYANLTDLNWN